MTLFSARGVKGTGNITFPEIFRTYYKLMSGDPNCGRSFITPVPIYSCFSSKLDLTPVLREFSSRNIVKVSYTLY